MAYLKKQLLISALLYIGQIGVGYCMGWAAPVVPKLQNPEESPIPILSTGDASWTVSSGFVGGLIGANIAGTLSNSKGRKPILQLGSVIITIAYLLLALSVNLPMIIVGRVLIGFGFAFVYIVSLVYIAEIATKSIRGILLSGTNVFCAFGILSAYIVGHYASYAVISYFGALITLAFGIGTLFIPESPVFNVLKGKETEASETLVQLGRASEIDEVLAIKLVGKPKSRTQEWRELFGIRTNRKALFITVMLVTFQQFSGGIPVTFYTTSLFQLANISLAPSVSTIIIGTTQLFGSFFTPIFIERLGRVPILLVSTAVCSLSLASLGVFFYLVAECGFSTDELSWLPLTSVIMFQLSCTLGFNILPETYMGEIFESNVRAPGSSFSVTIGWIVGFICASIYGYIITSLGGYITFWMFSGVCACAFIFTLIFVPETKGMSLIEIQYMLAK